jgi:hypothetical protein
MQRYGQHGIKTYTRVNIRIYYGCAAVMHCMSISRQDRVMAEPTAFQKAFGRFLLETAIAFIPIKIIQIIAFISRKLIDCKDPAVVEIWSNVFLECLKYMPMEAIVGQVN